MADITTKQIVNKLDSIDRWRAQIQAQQDKHDKTLYGNGEAGMDEQIRDILKWITKQEQTAERRRAWWDKLQWVVIPMAVAGVFVFIGQAFVFYFRIVPLLEAMK